MLDRWDQLLFRFRSLGGIADNVCQKKGEFGRGIFSINSKLKSKIYIPSTLMIKKDDICLVKNQLRIKTDTTYSEEIRKFFNYYQDNFSWKGGMETVESFEKGLSLFSPKLNELIKKYILIDLKKRHTGKWDQIIVREFLNARAFTFNNLSMICPLLELVNHEVISLRFISQPNGISTPNYMPIDGELTHNYNNKSSISRFFNYGFFCRESIVFSFPFSINLKNLGVNFVCKGQELDDDFIMIERSNKTITIKGLPVADVNHSKLPGSYFDEINRRIGDAKIPKDILFKIIEFNILVRQNILEESKLIDHEVSNIFSEIINYEINLISSYNYNYMNQ